MNIPPITKTIYQLRTLGCIEISGQDSIKFLQGQISINAEKLTEKVLSMASICTHQGRIVALFWITPINGAFYLMLRRELIASTINYLKKYAMFYKIAITNPTSQFDFYSYFNQSLSSAVCSPQGEPGHIASTEQFTLLFGPTAASKKWKAHIAQLGRQVQHDDEWFYQLAALKIPWLTTNTQENFLPHNLNLPALNAVDFNKGCFTGQEVIARVQYKGKLKSHMQLLSSSELIETGSTLWANNKAAGEIICMSSTKRYGTMALALIKDTCLDNKIFNLNNENGPILKLNN